MRGEIYDQIINEYRKLNSRNPRCLCSKFPEVPERTLCSIVSQEYKRKTKKFHYKHHTEEAINSYYTQYLKMCRTSDRQGFLLELADKVDLSPALMAHLILEKHYCKDEESANKQQLSQMMKDTTLIDDKSLSVEVYLCILNDEMYGAFSNATSHCIGQEYENKLKEKLKSLNVVFVDEDNLREKGYDKTPDIKLEIPVAIDGHVINWIESKASFGDKNSHRTYLKEQYWSYWNRFGPGMVIYWFGFIDDLDQNSDKGIILRDHMPENITFMNPLSLMNV